MSLAAFQRARCGLLFQLLSALMAMLLLAVFSPVQAQSFGRTTAGTGAFRRFARRLQERIEVFAH